jgi:hypothetical protein
MPTPGHKEIVAAKIALQALLTTHLLPDVTMTRFLADLPADDCLNDLPYTDAEKLIESLEGYLIYSVHFLIGRLSQIKSEAAYSVVSDYLENALLALVALQPEFKVAEEHYLLLADFYRRRGREEEASALLEFLEQPSGTPN